MKLLITNIVLGIIGMLYPLHIIITGLLFMPFPVDVQILEECMIQATFSVSCLIILILLNALAIVKNNNDKDNV